MAGRGLGFSFAAESSWVVVDLVWGFEKFEFERTTERLGSGIDIVSRKLGMDRITQWRSSRERGVEGRKRAVRSCDNEI
jgi:hypothetical protein